MYHDAEDRRDYDYYNGDEDVYQHASHNSRNPSFETTWM